LGRPARTVALPSSAVPVTVAMIVIERSPVLTAFNCLSARLLADELHWLVNALYSLVVFSLTHYPPAMAFGRRKILEDLSAVLSQFKKYRSSGNVKFNYLGIFQSLKLHILMEKNPFNFS